MYSVHVHYVNEYTSRSLEMMRNIFSRDEEIGMRRKGDIPEPRSTLEERIASFRATFSHLVSRCDCEPDNRHIKRRTATELHFQPENENYYSKFEVALLHRGARLSREENSKRTVCDVQT